MCCARTMRKFDTQSIIQVLIQNNFQQCLTFSYHSCYWNGHSIRFHLAKINEKNISYHKHTISSKSIIFREMNYFFPAILEVWYYDLIKNVKCIKYFFKNEMSVKLKSADCCKKFRNPANSFNDFYIFKIFNKNKLLNIICYKAHRFEK